MATSDESTTSELGRLAAVFVRRRWIWLPFVVVTPLMVFLDVRNDPARYAASAQVLLNRQNQVYSGVSDPTAWEPLRSMSTQIEIANRPDVGDLVADALKLEDRDGGDIWGQTSVSDFAATDILQFTTKDRDPKIARRIATEYARQYVIFRREFDTASLGRTAAALAREIRRLEAAGDSTSAVHARLEETRRRLATAVELQKGNAVFVRPADVATQVEPRPWEAARTALVLAVMVGLGLAFVVDTLDRRLRSPTDVADAFGLPLLARLPVRSRSVLRRARVRSLVARRESEAEAEAARQLRTNLELVASRGSATVVMVTTVAAARPDAMVAARLALSMARSGRRVVLVDLNLRAPTAHKLFAVPPEPGILDILFAGVHPRDVVRWIPTLVETSRTVSLGPRRDDAGEGGRLTVVTSGSDSAEAVELSAVALSPVLAALREDADLVILDAPPLLTSGAALAIATAADGVLLVTDPGVVRPGSAHEALRLLERASTTPLGLVLTEKPGQGRRLRRFGSSPMVRPA